MIRLVEVERLKFAFLCGYIDPFPVGLGGYLFRNRFDGPLLFAFFSFQS